MLIKFAINDARLELCAPLPLGSLRPTLDAFLNALPQGNAGEATQATVDALTDRLRTQRETLEEAVDRDAVAAPSDE